MDECIFWIHSDMFFFQADMPPVDHGGFFFYHFMGVGAVFFRSAGKNHQRKSGCLKSVVGVVDVAIDHFRISTPCH